MKFFLLMLLEQSLPWLRLFFVLVLSLLTATASYAAPGINTRPSNTTCVAPSRPAANESVDLRQAFPNLPPDGRVFVAVESPKNDPTYLYGMFRAGLIFRFQNINSVAERSRVLDLRPLFEGTSQEGQSGLMDMAFHPDFSNNGELYISYTVPGDNRTGYVARYISNDNGATFSEAGEIVLAVPQKEGVTHGIGTLFFGKNGYLYVGFGDGGNMESAQDPFNLFGKILRIDVDGGAPYGIPPDNPFANGGGAPEVYAMGLRNPWRVSQDRSTGEIWAGDVGEMDWEEVNKIVPGGNYGWPIKEGTQCLDAGCDSTGLIDPIHVYSSRTDGCAVIGGHVYRGSLIPSLVGKYIYADQCSGQITALQETSLGVIVEPIINSGLAIVDFSEAPNKELFVTAAGNESQILQLQPNNNGSVPPNAPDAFPTKLSETGCFDPLNPLKVVEGVIPYRVNAALWSDGTAKRRWLAIPNGTQITVLPDGDWDFPVGSVLIKEFFWNGSPFETRLMVRHADGGWAGYTYEWNPSKTDANLVPAGGVARQIDGQLNWQYPSQTQCMECHSGAAGRSLGLETAQLNGLLRYPSGVASNQLETLNHIGMFANDLGGPANKLPALAAANDPNRTVFSRARSYLHSNCSMCHRPNGPGQGPMDFRFYKFLADTSTCNVAPENGDFGIPGAKIVTPGNAARSIISLRMHTLGNQRMPPLSTQVVDPQGTAIIDAWINSLKACSPAQVSASPGVSGSAR